jgi:hypothetical protein
VKFEQADKAMSYAAKRTALALYGLARDDRKWLLDQLTAPQRREVERAEAVLGKMVRDRPLNFEELIAPTVRGEASREWDHEVKKTLDKFPYDTVKRALDALPATWIAGILDQSAWKEAPRYLGELKASDREIVRAGSDFRPRVSTTLTLALASELTRGSNYG